MIPAFALAFSLPPLPSKATKFINFLSDWEKLRCLRALQTFSFGSRTSTFFPSVAGVKKSSKNTNVLSIRQISAYIAIACTNPPLERALIEDDKRRRAGGGGGLKNSTRLIQSQLLSSHNLTACMWTALVCDDIKFMLFWLDWISCSSTPSTSLAISFIGLLQSYLSSYLRLQMTTAMLVPPHFRLFYRSLKLAIWLLLSDSFCAMAFLSINPSSTWVPSDELQAL